MLTGASDIQAQRQVIFTLKFFILNLKSGVWKTCKLSKIISDPSDLSVIILSSATAAAVFWAIFD